MANVEAQQGGFEDGAGLVHDLGNLIQIASSAVNIVARSADIRNASLESVLSGAAISLERAAALARRGAGGAREAAAERVRVADCLAELEALARVGWSMSPVRLMVRVAPDLPDLRCDRLALQNAVLNLALNARDAMPDGGVVEVGAEAVVLGDASGIAIHVADRGVGMKPETVLRALDPFFTTKSEGLGGVGLPMVERFAREAGGRLLIDSVFGAGTTVTLHLPAAAPETDAPEGVFQKGAQP